GTDFFAARYTESGAPDISFGSDGISEPLVTTPNRGAANAVAVTADGKVVLAGSVGSGTSTQAAVVRLERDPGVILTPTSGLVTTEFRGPAPFTVVPAHTPATPVDVILNSTDASEGTVSPITLHFTPENALIPQTVTVTGVDDHLLDGDVSYLVGTLIADGSDPAYSGVE